MQEAGLRPPPVWYKMVQVDSGKVRLVDKDDSMMEHWSICFIIFLYHGLKLLRRGHINSISILNILEKDFHCIPVSLGACLSTNSRRLLSSADPPPTFPTCEQPSMSCGGSRKQSLQREREREIFHQDLNHISCRLLRKVIWGIANPKW